MYEVEIRLRFTTPCLGHVRHDDYDRFLYDATGAVTFMSSWWLESLRYGAQGLGRHQHAISDILFDSKIAGDVKKFKRYYSTDKYKEHEAFLTGTDIVVTAMVPDGVPINDLNTILTIAGKYRGISPYGWRTGYGRFDVINVRHFLQETTHGPSSNKTVRKHSGSLAQHDGTAASDTDVHPS
jgi:hypothetical protein